MRNLPSAAAALLRLDPTAVYRCVFEAAPDHVAISRLSDGAYIEVNPGFERFTGWRREEVIGRNSIDIKLWRSEQERAEFVATIRRDGSCKAFPLQFCVRSG